MRMMIHRHSNIQSFTLLYLRAIARAHALASTNCWHRLVLVRQTIGRTEAAYGVTLKAMYDQMHLAWIVGWRCWRNRTLDEKNIPKYEKYFFEKNISDNRSVEMRQRRVNLILCTREATLGSDI